MTKREAEREFKQQFSELTFKYFKLRDKPRLRELWVIFIDDLHRERRITDKQASNWDQII